MKIDIYNYIRLSLTPQSVADDEFHPCGPVPVGSKRYDRFADGGGTEASAPDALALCPLVDISLQIGKSRAGDGKGVSQDAADVLEVQLNAVDGPRFQGQWLHHVSRSKSSLTAFDGE